MLLDLVARDGKGLRVGDLQRGELEVLEDDKPCEIQSLRLVHAAGEGDAGRAGASAQATQSAPSPEPSSPGRANLVVLVFGGLYVDMAP